MTARVALLAAANVLIASCASQQGASVTLQLNPYVGRLVFVDADIRGQTVPMLLDTGAGVTALTPEAAALIGCVPFGRLVGHRMSGERVEFQRCGDQTLVFGDYEADGEIYVFDLMALLPEELPALGGIVSLASFFERPFTLDLAGRNLMLETRESLRERIKQAKEADLRITRGTGGDAETTAFIKVEAETGDLWFLLDSANLDHVFISPHALDQLGDTAGEGQSEGVFDLDLVLGGGIPVSVTARLRDTLYDGAFNEEVMSRFLITFDLKNERLWLTPNGDPGAGVD